jgi:pimeloyl-ACP methyl ester carboxylesterase
VSEPLAEARTLLEQRPDGHLPLPERRRLRAAWGFDAAGLSRRHALARLTVERVLPRWEQRWPDDRRPHDLVGLADEVAAGRSDPQAAIMRATAVATDLDDLMEDAPDDPALFAAHSAVALVVAAAAPEEPERLGEAEDDQEVESDEWPPEFWASLAEAPSLPRLQPPEQVEPRRAFWRWYLDEAVPAAGAST